MKKIIIFDCWTKGAGHLIAPLMENFAKASYNCKFIHFESVYNNKFPSLVKKDSVECFDFSYYKTFNIINILKKEKPDLIILMGKEGLIERAQIKAANLLKIPTLFIQHGTIPPPEIKGSYYQNIYSFSFYVQNLRRLIKMLSIYLIASLSLDRLFFLRPNTYCLFYSLLTNPHKFYFTYPDEIKPDKLVVYGESDRKFFIERYHYKEEQIEAIGSPFLDEVCLMSKKRKNIKKNNFSILLFTKPYAEDQLFGWSKEKNETFIKNVYKVIRKHKMSLVIKIHPRENIETYKSFFKSFKGIKIIQTDLDEAIYKSDLVLSFYSTALYNAIILRKPIILINWIKGIPLESDLEKFGIVKQANSIKEYEKLLKEFGKKDFFDNDYEYNRAQFIQYFMYKDDGQAMQRILKVAENLIKSKA